jgi:hypothetical protein
MCLHFKVYYKLDCREKKKKEKKIKIDPLKSQNNIAK